MGRSKPPNSLKGKRGRERRRRYLPEIVCVKLMIVHKDYFSYYWQVLVTFIVTVGQPDINTVEFMSCFWLPVKFVLLVLYAT